MKEKISIRMNYKIKTIFFALVGMLMTPGGAEPTSKELRHAASDLYETLQIGTQELLEVEEISTSKVISESIDASYTFFKIKFGGQTIEELRKLSPLLMHLKEGGVNLGDSLNGFAVAPRWPDAALKEAPGFWLNWEHRKTIRRTNQARTIAARGMNLECAFLRDQKLLVGFIEVTSLPTNGTFPDVVVDDSPTVFRKSEEKR